MRKLQTGLTQCITVVSTALVVGSMAPLAVGAEWQSDAAVRVGSFYTDNVCFAPEDEEGKVVGTFTPRVSLRGDGGRARMALRAAVEYNTLGDSDIRCQNQGFGGNLRNREPWVPRVDFQSSVDAIGRWLVLEANARAAQNPINPFAAGGDENLNARGNTNITSQWGVGARINHQHSDEWSYLLSYSYNEQYNSQNVGIGDNSQDLVILDVGQLPTASRLTFRVNGLYQEVFFEEQRGLPAFENRLSSLELRANFLVSDAWSANAAVGEEDNLFTSAPGSDIDGSFWDVGVRWAPNPRIAIGVGYGQRFFGDTPRFDVSYRHKRSSLTASYQRDLQFPRNLRGTGGGFNPDDPGALPPDFLPGDGVGTPDTPTFIGNQPVINDRFTLLYRFTARRTDLSISLTDSQQTRVGDGRDGQFRIASASINRSISDKANVFARFRWQDNAAQGGFPGSVSQGLETFQYTLGLARRMTSRSRATLQYRLTDLRRQQEARNFTEQRIGVTYTYNF